MSAKGSVLKRVRQADKGRQKNRHYRSLLSSTIKRAMAVKDKKEAPSELSKAQVSSSDSINELKREVKSLRQDVSKGKGAVAVLVFVGTLVVSIIGFLNFK